jgi:hypothetical protein
MQIFAGCIRPVSVDQRNKLRGVWLVLLNFNMYCSIFVLFDN